jgi:hypothetical protein
MQQFIARQNIEHFEKLIEHESDPEQRRRLEQLMSEERQKLAAALTDAEAAPAKADPAEVNPPGGSSHS